MLDELAIALMAETWDGYRCVHGCPEECPFEDFCRKNEPDRLASDREGLCLPVAKHFIQRALTLKASMTG